MENYDIIIIGAGPAGLTAGIYAGRQGSKTLILEKALVGGAGLEVPSMENYPGFELIAGMSLIAKTKKQTEKNATIREIEDVNHIKKCENGFEIKTTKDNYFGKSIIITTGTVHKLLDISGEEEFKGRGVCYCATCDGLLYKDKDVLIIGGGNSAAQEAIFLDNVGCNVTLIHRKDELRAEDYLKKKLKEKEIPIIWNSTIKEIKGNQMLKSVVLLNKEGTKKEVKVEGIFIAIGDTPSSSIAKDLDLKLDENNYVITDKGQRTNIDNIYAAGDVTGGVKQWVVACGEGAVAAISAYQDLEKRKEVS